MLLEKTRLSILTLYFYSLAVTGCILPGPEENREIVTTSFGTSFYKSLAVAKDLNQELAEQWSNKLIDIWIIARYDRNVILEVLNDVTVNYIDKQYFPCGSIEKARSCVWPDSKWIDIATLPKDNDTLTPINYAYIGFIHEISHLILLEFGYGPEQHHNIMHEVSPDLWGEI